MGAGSSIPLMGIFFSDVTMVILLAVLSGVAVAVETARFRLPSFNRLLVRRFSSLLKETEDRRITGATYIAIAALISFLVFDKPVAITALFFLSLGDPAAALVGSHVGSFTLSIGPRFGRSSRSGRQALVRVGRVFGKSPWGTLAFMIVAIAVAGVLSAADVVTFHSALAAGAAVAALVELIPSGLDDNVTIPLVSGAAMTLMIGI